MARLIRIGQLTYTTDDEQEHELVGWNYIEERNRGRSGSRSSGTLF